jgi:hypothetical protein
MAKHYYGRPLVAKVERGEVVIRIGCHTLAHAASFADWANPYCEDTGDYIRTFAIADPEAFAREVVRAMTLEEENGASPLTDFLDKAMSDAVDDGAEGLYDGEVKVPHGQTHASETWANRPAREESPDA